MALGFEHAYLPRQLDETHYEIVRVRMGTLEETRQTFPGHLRDIPAWTHAGADPADWVGFRLVQDASRAWFRLNLDTGKQTELLVQPPQRPGSKVTYLPLDLHRSPERTDGQDSEGIAWEANHSHKQPGYNAPGAAIQLFSYNGERLGGLPLDRPYTPAWGHFAWVGRTRGFLLTTHWVDFVIQKALGNLFSAWPGDRQAKLQGRGQIFIHIDSSVDGRFWIADDLEEARVTIGSLRTGRSHVLLHSNATLTKGDQCGHPHASITPDNQWAVFNSDREGVPHLYAARIPEGLLEELES
jgi:hypothetical protein